MAASSPDSARALPVTPWALAAIVLFALAAGAPALAQQQEILLEAASSDFDRRGEKLLFRDVRIQQGDIVITAAEAETRDLEFSSGQWEFRGNARIDGPMGSIQADRATIGFSNHQLQSAVAEGAPARFTRTMPGPEARRVDGTANRISYDLREGELSLQGQARLSDGVREASGARLVYRIAEDRLIASADEEGTERVRIIITPPEDGNQDGQDGQDDEAPREPEPTP
ncbi:lipopolysaccharide transport periplasmic protein LptA [Thioalkalivibrio sp. XN279]|uniref:lipopolysaccharide transport periplasmic protein LptA n=1 Tax=Thioalkalivibrio sp. XN279 TaxID=2714953 RepID=UPI001409AFC5|nr:lipopolysaccharide transport periplasmic protein LptA [Thioalkalivibrio sp. XN279]NHA16100.1 lipopolysaccharide transport periplasmic protein LptA [Thioalkalivibrio sp. XN279]